MSDKASVHSIARPRFLGGLFAGGAEDQSKRILRVVGQFLMDHRLAPTPANYTVAYTYVTQSDAALVDAVAKATYGDTRLSQLDADRVLGLVCGRMSEAGVKAAMGELSASIDDARQRFERYAGIVDTSHADAQAYGVALANGVETLGPAAPKGEAVALAALLAATQSMVEKTRVAEEQLHAASQEMSELRANLAAARQDAETDALTGLPNRRAFEAGFARRRDAAPTRRDALAMCDIDRFKRINDAHGHDVGDRVIRLVARELADGCAGAIVARYGGEEFVLLFEGCDAAEATRALDATRAAMSRRSFRVSGTDATLDALSFSGGVVSVRPREPVRDAVRRADDALYRAKQAGRDRIERAD